MLLHVHCSHCGKVQKSGCICMWGLLLPAFSTLCIHVVDVSPVQSALYQKLHDLAAIAYVWCFSLSSNAPPKRLASKAHFASSYLYMWSYACRQEVGNLDLLPIAILRHGRTGSSIHSYCRTELSGSSFSKETMYNRNMTDLAYGRVSCSRVHWAAQCCFMSSSKAMQQLLSIYVSSKS